MSCAFFSWYDCIVLHLGQWTHLQSTRELLARQLSENIPGLLKTFEGIFNILISELGQYSTLFSVVSSTPMPLCSFGVEASWRLGKWQFLTIQENGLI